MTIEIFSYLKGSDLSRLLTKFINFNNRNLRFVIPSKKNNSHFFRRIGINTHGIFDDNYLFLWTWQDIYEDICKFLKLKRRRILSPPDHLLILKFILNQVLNEQPEKITLYPGLVRAGFPGIISNDISELVNENVNPVLLKNLLKKDNPETPAEFLLPEVYERYLNYLKNHDLMDSAQIWNCANELLNENINSVSWAKDLEFVFTGFLSFTHGQLELLHSLEKICKKIVILKPEADLKDFHDASVQFLKNNLHAKSTGKILEIPIAEPSLEPEVIARNLALWSQNQGEFSKELAFNSYDDVGILIASGRENSMIEALERYKIPFNFESGISIDSTLPGKILSSIRILRSQRFPAYDTAMILTQSCFAGRRFNASKAFKNGASGLKNWKDYLSSQSQLENQDYEIFEKALLAINSIEIFCNKLSRKKTPAEIMRAFHEFLTVPGLWLDNIPDVPDELDESIRITASAIQTVSEKVLALDELLPDLGRVQDEKLSDDDSFDFLESWCRNSKTRPPIQVSNAVKIFTSTPPVLSTFPVWIMLGITQNSWSESVTNSPLLGQKERDDLNLSGSYLPTNQDKAQQREALFRRLIHTGENLTVISRPELDEEDRPIDESPFMTRFFNDMSGWQVRKTSGSGINILINDDGYIFPEIDSQINVSRFKPLIQDKCNVIGASDLKRFLSCPYAWWLGKRAEIYAKTSDLATSIDWGNMAHSLWEYVWKRYSEENINGNGIFFKNILNEEWDYLTKSENQYEKYSWLVKDFRLKRALEGIKFRIMRLGQLQADILDELHDSGYFHKVILLEENARLSTKINGLLCSGQCDRIEILSDVSGSNFAIISDYKEGKSENYEKPMSKLLRYKWNFEQREKFKYGLQISAYAAMFSKSKIQADLSGICFLGLEDGLLSGTFDENFNDIYSSFASKKFSGNISERIDEGEYAIKCAANIFNSGILEPDYDVSDCKNFCKMKSICRRGEFYGENLLNEFNENDSDNENDDE